MMTPREALEMALSGQLTDWKEFQCSKRTEALKILEALVLVAEQAPTLEKLGYRLNKDESGTVIKMYEGKFKGTKGKSIIIENCKTDPVVYFNGMEWVKFSELLACATVIRKLEKENRVK